jgi:hypothetical protein
MATQTLKAVNPPLQGAVYVYSHFPDRGPTSQKREADALLRTLTKALNSYAIADKRRPANMALNHNRINCRESEAISVTGREKPTGL